jgi:hypothetical protein
MTPTSLEIVSELPKMPLLVVSSDTLARVETLSASVNALVIRSAAEAQDCALLMREASDLYNAVELQRTAIKAPVLDLERKIDAAARKPLETLRTVRAVASDRLRKWESDEQRRLAEEARKREEERLRIEREKARVEAERLRLEKLEQDRKDREAREEAQRLAQALAQAKAPLADDDDPFDSPEPVAPAPVEDDFADLAAAENQRRAAELARQEAALAVPVAPAQKPEGISYRTTLKFEVTNLDLLPKEYVTRFANEAAIRGRFCVGFNERQPLPTLPGVRFYVQKDPITTARR